MKSVLLSIKPKYCQLIAEGKKTIEVRKSRPKLETPFKVYIYQTTTTYRSRSKENDILVPDNSLGKVIGEFVCSATYQISAHKTDDFHGKGFVNCSDFGPYFGLDANKILKDACLSGEDILKYLGDNMTGFAWHITDLVIYDEPKELSDFVCLCPEYEKPKFTAKCRKCLHYYKNYRDMCYECDCEGEKTITRAPQSWCYVEEVV